MISTGAATLFALVAFLAGLATGTALRYRHRDTTNTDVGQEWGEIDKAATDAYRAVHAARTAIKTRRAAVEIAEARAMTLPQAKAAARRALLAAYGQPPEEARLMVTMDSVDPHRPYMLDGEGLAALAGVDAATILGALRRG